MLSLSLDEAGGAGGGARIGSENPLEEHQVEPALEFPSDLPEMRDLFEAEFGVQLQARRVGRIDAGHHGMKAAGARDLDKRAQDGAADPSAALLRGYIDRVLDRVEIRGPGAERAVTGEPRYHARVETNQHRKILRAL